MNEDVRDAILVVCTPFILIFCIINTIFISEISDKLEEKQNCITHNNEIYCKED